VDAADYAELISRDIGEKGRLDLVVLVEDSSGQTFKIRPPFHPKEVARFHRILLDAKLDVQFETHHAFLLLLDNKDHIAGGVFWKKTGPAIAQTICATSIVLTSVFRIFLLLYASTVNP